MRIYRSDRHVLEGSDPGERLFIKLSNACKAPSYARAFIHASGHRPLPQVGSWLRVEATVTERAGRKVWVRATLSDPAAKAGETLHCEAKGLFLLKK